MLTKRQKVQIRTAFKMAALGGRVVFVIHHESQAREFVGHLRSTYGDETVRVKKRGHTTEIRCFDGPGVVWIEPFHFRNQFQGREFSEVFVDEWAELDREAFNFLISRVR